MGTSTTSRLITGISLSSTSACTRWRRLLGRRPGIRYPSLREVVSRLISFTEYSSISSTIFAAFDWRNA